MKYKNENGQEFSIKMEDYKWTVRFGPVWKIYKVFNVMNDENVREVFWILSKLKNCSDCKRELLIDKDQCESCRALRLSKERPVEPIQQCCICYQELFDVLDNKVRLRCAHSICKTCCSKIGQQTGDFTWDMIAGILYLSLVKCPMCRDISIVTTNDFRLVTQPYNMSI